MMRHAPSIGLGLGLSLRGSGGVGFRGLLDQYGGAAAAYSLRALSSGWLAGDVVEVRRSSDSTTQDFTASQILNGDLVTFCGVGDGFVATWYDQSGFANDATQATTTAQPKIVSAGSLVTGGLDFDGVDDRFTSALAHSADISAFLTSTINQDNTSNSERIVYLADGSDSFQITRASTAESFELSSKNTAFQATIAAFRHGVSPIGLNLVTMITSSSATSAFSDGASTTNSAQALGAGGNATTTIGARDDLLASSFFKGQMDEIIIYNSDQSANRVAIETNINDAYSIF